MTTKNPNSGNNPGLPEPVSIPFFWGDDQEAKFAAYQEHQALERRIGRAKDVTPEEGR